MFRLTDVWKYDFAIVGHLRKADKGGMNCER
jgi:hypothetical protein